MISDLNAFFNLKASTNLLLFQLQGAAQAERHCQTQGGPDAHLASIDNDDENLHIWNRMHNLTTLPNDPHGWWIGYQKDGLGKDRDI